MNRGAARRPVFENRADMRTFRAQVARAVRRGEIEVHAFCLLLNHFHLLVLSREGRLSHAMQRITNAYVRRFNRRRKRDGSLFRGRFRSRAVTSLVYRRTVVRYIDDNPVHAGMVDDAAKYPWSGRPHFASCDGPLWHARDWIEAEVARAAGRERFDPEDYPRAFPSKRSPEVRAWVERRLCYEGSETACLDDLLACAPPAVRERMARRLFRADHAERGDPLLTPESVQSALDEDPDARREWRTARGGQRRAAAPFVEAGLLSGLCGLSHREIAARLRIPRSTVRDRVLAHRDQLERDTAGYGDRCADIASRALALFRESLQS